MSSKSLRPCLFFVLCLICVGQSASSAVSAPPAVGETASRILDKGLSQEQLDAARKAAESDSLLDDAQRQKAMELYDQASRWLQQATESKARLAGLEALLRGAAQRTETIRKGDLSFAMDDIQPLLDEGRPEQIELALTNEELALQAARDTHRRQAEELTGLLVGSTGLNAEIAAGSQALEDIEADLQAPAAEQAETLEQARIHLLEARRMLRRSELNRLKLRLSSHDLLTNLAQAERDAAAAEIAQRQRRLAALSTAAQEIRESRAREAREQAEALQIRTDSLPQPLQVIARETADYRLELEKLVGREKAVAIELQSARSGLDGLKTDFERTRQRVEVVGATEAIRKLLQRRREALPSLQNYRRASAARAAEIGRSTDRQIEIDELLRERGDVGDVVGSALSGLPETVQSQHRSEAGELTIARRDALNELQKVYGRYIGQITALDLSQRQLVGLAEGYGEYIDDQLVWIPGTSLTGVVRPSVLGAAVAWLLSMDNWAQLGGDLGVLIDQRPLRLSALLLVFYLLLRKHRWAGERLSAIAPRTRKIRSDSFRLTVQALALSLVFIGAWPLLMIGSGWLLGQLPSASGFTLSVAAGLLKAGMVWFSLRFLIQICLPDGLGDRHLRWPQTVREALVRELGWLLRPAVPLAFLVAAGTGHEPSTAMQSLGQFAFIILMLLSALFLYRLLRRGSPFMAAAGDNGALVQLHFLWFPAFVLLPLGLAMASALGYHQAALHLQWHAEMTFWLFVGLFLVKELLLRSLYIAERRLRLEDALRRRDELRAQRALGEGDDKDDGAAQISLDIPEVNFNELSEQSRRLLQAGFLFGAVAGIWSIWADLLPALGFLYRTELPLHAARIVDGIAKEVPISLGDLTVGFIMVLITILAAKNIPGVLEIALLQRLPLDPGARYAITALTQYVIAGIGVVLAFSTLGLQWSSIQWLVAALGVGLGFGLQEIVANFISGIILLFERPIRVGDTVTLDNTTGVVSRIRIRATTITNYDKQELLIPNKEFITGRVINWTLSDKTNRVVVTVGVAYGTDVARAMELMLEAARENENVLDEPKPVASFESFGDNALTLLLRSYLGSMDNRLNTITALHQAINDKFNAAGINIAFPQRDIHLSTEKPLDIRLHHGRGNTKPSAG